MTPGEFMEWARQGILEGKVIRDLYITEIPCDDISGATFVNCKFAGVYFIGRALGVTIEACTLETCRFVDCDFTGSRFDRTSLLTCDFHLTKFVDTRWQRVSILKSVFNGAIFSGSTFLETYLTQSVMENGMWLGGSVKNSRSLGCLWQGTVTNVPGIGTEAGMEMKMSIWPIIVDE